MICTEFTERYNDFLEHNPRWEVILEDDTKVYQDDFSYHEKTAWERLRDYCSENNLKIKHFKAGFRDNIVTLPDGKDGYYFRKMARGYFGGGTRQFFLIGYIENDIIIIHKYCVPEFILEEETFRDIDNNDPSLIY